MTKPTAFEVLVIQSTLAHMFRVDGCLSICDLDACWKLANVAPDETTRAALRLLHCKSWTALPEQMRAYAAAEVAHTFGWEPSKVLAAVTV